MVMSCLFDISFTYGMAVDELIHVQSSFGNFNQVNIIFTIRMDCLVALF